MTAVSGLAFGLDQAILIGVVLSVALFVPRAAKLNVSELIVDEDRVVRARRGGEDDNEGFLIFDLEGELFFGVAAELEKTFAEVKDRLRTDGVDKLLLRMKRVRNPDVVMLEQLGHFLKDLQDQGVEVWLVGLRPDLIAAMRRLKFDDWFPEDRLRPHGAEDYSATLAAIRDIRDRLPSAASATPSGSKLYYLV